MMDMCSAGVCGCGTSVWHQKIQPQVCLYVDSIGRDCLPNIRKFRNNIWGTCAQNPLGAGYNLCPQPSPCNGQVRLSWATTKDQGFHARYYTTGVVGWAKWWCGLGLPESEYGNSQTWLTGSSAACMSPQHLSSKMVQDDGNVLWKGL